MRAMLIRERCLYARAHGIAKYIIYSIFYYFFQNPVGAHCHALVILGHVLWILIIQKVTELSGTAVQIVASHPGDPGSIPGEGKFFPAFFVLDALILSFKK